VPHTKRDLVPVERKRDGIPGKRVHSIVKERKTSLLMLREAGGPRRIDAPPPPHLTKVDVS